jgi:hypothetical protein
MQFGGKKNMSLIAKLNMSKLYVVKQGDPVAAAQVYDTQQGTATSSCVYVCVSLDHAVIQLIKSRSKVQKLGVLFEGRQRKDYTFASMQVCRHSVYIYT